MPDARFRGSAGGVSPLGLYLVWYPKYPHRLLGGRVATPLGEIAAQKVMPGHLHVLVRVRLTDSPAEVFRRFKGRTSRVLGQEFAWLSRPKVLGPKRYFAAGAG